MQRLEVPHPRHDGGALRIGQLTPVNDFVDRAAAADAGRAIPVQRTQVAAGADKGRCHYMKL